MSEFTEYTDEDRNTRPRECHLCGSEDVPLTNYSLHYGSYTGPHWLCGLCAVTQAGSRIGVGFHRNDHTNIVADIAAMLHAAGLTPKEDPEDPEPTEEDLEADYLAENGDPGDDPPEWFDGVTYDTRPGT